MVESSSKVALWNRALARIGHTVRVASESDDSEAADLCRLVHDPLLREVLGAQHWKWARRQRALLTVDSQASTSPAAAGGETDFFIPFPFLGTSQVKVVKIAVGGGETVLVPVTDYTFPEVVEGKQPSVKLVVALVSGEKVRITVTVSREGWEHLYVLPNDCVTPIALLGDGERYDLQAVDVRHEWARMLNDAGDGYVLASNLPAADIEALEYVAMVTHVPVFPPKFEDCFVWRLAAELALGLKKDVGLGGSYLQQYEGALRAASAEDQNVGHSAKVKTPSAAAR